MSLDGWRHFDATWFHDDSLGVSLDVSGVPGWPEHWEQNHSLLHQAMQAMEQLEAGCRANPDEGRRVGHYWLRDPERAPEPDITAAIRSSQEAIRNFASGVAEGRIAPAAGGVFRHVLHIGIGGSALGPQLVNEALPGTGCRLHFLDNTDPDGMRRVLAGLGDALSATLTVVVSKSGGTRETVNGLQAASAAYARQGVVLAPHAVAITAEGSALDRQAMDENWLLRLPLPDWVGGRTSETSAVGLLPLALAGGDMDAFLDGACRMDALTRAPAEQNPAARLAMAWHALTGGGPGRAMVVLPYRDRLGLLARYLQQLVMESLGKERDLQGREVHQGLTVYGNKGTSDQHAFVQQLREGPNDFFATFIHVLEEPDGCMAPPPEQRAAGDDLLAFMLGTRHALQEAGRPALMLTLQRLDACSLGGLIALFERTVGLYASLIGVNAYHQPGVEAGKQAAGSVLALQAALEEALAGNAGRWMTAMEVAEEAGHREACQAAFHLLRHLAATREGVVQVESGASPAVWRFQRKR